MDKNLIAFSQDGVVKDTGDLVMKQFAVEHQIELNMRHNGCVPVLDLVPELQTEYDAEKGVFHYTITMWGKPVKNPEKYEGVLGWQLIEITPGKKSKIYSKPAASMS